MTPGEPQGCVDVFFWGGGVEEGGGRGTTHDEIDVAVPSNLHLARKVFFRFISRIPFV